MSRMREIKPMTTKQDNIMLTGRRWFEKVNGNTYHSARAYFNGVLIGEVKFVYGYGNQCVWTAWDILIKAKFVQPKKYNSGGHEAPWGYCQRLGIKYQEEITDVSRKKDL